MKKEKVIGNASSVGPKNKGIGFLPFSKVRILETYRIRETDSRRRGL